MAATRDKIGYAEMRRILEANPMKHLEIEAVVDWYKTGEERAKADLLRAQIFEAVNELGMRRPTSMAAQVWEKIFSVVVRESGF
ncbi:hypothetical protein CN172_17265 [Sinorhizobium meliloti]|uniref:hypothetical protein n=1 Tax=Rhizobium meliloti TaxID=382 RepID=UPI000FD979ED|nr:hypothetical protein [Sinorhizobium meliloti]RVE88644.1 hypothetical protein CN232_33070 [Sinorhizobium meliloti]RVH41846.1 hypothetical protein CN208_20275 [Sinorhizobium meliloti]RVI65207.1 hypothetical protein CN189_12060 [Sinorhizobium meliloti]RVK12903.1 hypothetical protein CN172_17265 [Sinorhizobium meliloti]